MERDEYKKELDMLKIKMQRLQCEWDSDRVKIANFSEYKVQNENLRVENKQIKESYKNLDDMMKAAIEENNVIHKQMEEDYERILTERNNVNQELNDLFHEKSEKDIIIKTLTKENLEMGQKITELTHEIQELEDLNKKFDYLSDILDKVEKIKEKYKLDLEICSNYLLEVEEKCQETQKH